MKTVKKIIRYIIIIGLLFLFVTYASDFLVGSTYKEIENKGIISEEFKFEDLECKATYINGKLKGTVLNNSENAIEYVRVIADFTNKRENVIGVDYTELHKLEPNEAREFEIDFKFEKVTGYKLTTSTERIPENENKSNILKNAYEYIVEHPTLSLLGGLVVLLYI